MERHGEICAARRFNWRQLLFGFLLAAAVLIGFVRDYKITCTVLMFALCGFYGAVIFFRLFSVVLALFRVSEHRVDAAALAGLSEADLPVYTVLVPMYKEPEVAEKIISAVTHLDYPQEKLDVILLLEEDDRETREKIEAVRDRLPACVSIFAAPCVAKGEPRTKPRACNWGLERARGEFLVIFDAEDQPEPDQLKKAVCVFRQLEAAGKRHVACLQAKLNYFNARQNLLTRCFTLEYTNWFDLFLPGLHAAGTPIPLGGTSNHFRTALLKQAGGWDPFNVTEDCDLGLRLTRQGFATEVLDSTTWEEAVSRVPNWIRQRSRWVKGYFQTHLVHTRDAYLPLLALSGVFLLLYNECTLEGAHAQMPASGMLTAIAVLKHACLGLAVLAMLGAASAVWSVHARKHRRLGEAEIGPWQALTFRFTVGGLSAMLLLNLIFWVMTLAYLGRGPLSRALPDAIGEVRLDDQTLTVREALSGWNLYYTNVTSERYEGTTFWNTLTGFLGGPVTWSEARERMNAIDSWSLVSQLFYPVAVMLFAANFLFVLLGLISCQKRRMWDLVPVALLMPLYWVLISVAAVKGFAQLFTDPFYWEKTVHGHTSMTASVPVRAEPQLLASPASSAADSACSERRDSA